MSKQGMRFRNAYFTNPDIILALQQREMRNENLINKIRFGLLICFAILDILAFTLVKGANMRMYVEFGGFIVFVFIAAYLIHRFSSDGKFRPRLKYITVTFDFLIFLSVPAYIFRFYINPFPLGKNEVMLLFTFAIIIYNAAGILRSQRKIVFYNSALAILLNTIMFTVFNPNFVLLAYTTVFLLLAAIFIYAMSGYIVNSEASNIMLKQANNEISKQKSEIEAQRDEIEGQRDRLSRQNTLLANKNEQIQQSIQYASRIQSAVLPDIAAMQNTFADFMIFYKPRDIVSGDFYWLNILGNKIIITAADCTGHGVPGAFMSLLGISFLNELSSLNRQGITEGSYQASDMLDDLRGRVKSTLHQNSSADSAKDGMDIALIILDTQSLQASFAGAYNPLYLIRSGELQKCKADRMPIGIYRKNRPFTNHKLQLQQGDRFYMFSDGFTDQFGGPKGQKFKTGRFQELLTSNYSKPMKEQNRMLDKTLREWRGGKYAQLDDALVIGVHV